MTICEFDKAAWQFSTGRKFVKYLAVQLRYGIISLLKGRGTLWTKKEGRMMKFEEKTGIIDLEKLASESETMTNVNGGNCRNSISCYIKTRITK